MVGKRITQTQAILTESLQAAQLGRVGQVCEGTLSPHATLGLAPELPNWALVLHKPPNSCSSPRVGGGIFFFFHLANKIFPSHQSQKSLGKKTSFVK